jgi:hypothetical protein
MLHFAKIGPGIKGGQKVICLPMQRVTDTDPLSGNSGLLDNFSKKNTALNFMKIHWFTCA